MEAEARTAAEALAVLAHTAAPMADTTAVEEVTRDMPPQAATAEGLAQAVTAGAVDMAEGMEAPVEVLMRADPLPADIRARHTPGIPTAIALLATCPRDSIRLLRAAAMQGQIRRGDRLRLDRRKEDRLREYQAQVRDPAARSLPTIRQWPTASGTPSEVTALLAESHMGQPSAARGWERLLPSAASATSAPPVLPETEPSAVVTVSVAAPVGAGAADGVVGGSDGDGVGARAGGGWVRSGPGRRIGITRGGDITTTISLTFTRIHSPTVGQSSRGVSISKLSINLVGPTNAATAMSAPREISPTGSSVSGFTISK